MAGWAPEEPAARARLNLPSTIPTAGRHRMKHPPDRDIWSDHYVHEAREGHGKGEATAELQGGQSKHGPEMAPEALRRGILQPIRDIRDREAGRLEQIRSVQQPDSGEIVLGRR